MYDVVVNENNGEPDCWKTDLTTGSRRHAVTRARRIAGAWPWERRRVVRIIHGTEIVDFNQER